MTEQQIEDILDSNSYMECVKKIATIYPNGFDINKIDKRIKDKLEELTNKYDSIQKPIQIRKRI
jgi:hypothetical protein